MAIANGSSVDTNTAAFKQAISACKDLEPPGFTGNKRSAQQQRRALKFAQCIRDNGVKDFPDPTPMGPSSTRIESRPPQERWHEHSQRRDAEVPRLSSAAGARGAGDAEDVGAGRSGRPGCRGRHRRRGRHVRCEASDTGRAEPPANTATVEQGKLSAMVSQYWDPDLSGAIGRLAVHRDQPGPRDLHRAARCRRQGRLRRRALPGGRPPGAAAVRHGPGLPRAAQRRHGQRRPSAQPEPAHARLRRRCARSRRQRLHRQDGEGAREAPARQGLRRDRSARCR